MKNKKKLCLLSCSPWAWVSQRDRCIMNKIRMKSCGAFRFILIFSILFFLPAENDFVYLLLFILIYFCITNEMTMRSLKPFANDISFASFNERWTVNTKRRGNSNGILIVLGSLFIKIIIRARWKSLSALNDYCTHQSKSKCHRIDKENDQNR